MASSSSDEYSSSSYEFSLTCSFLAGVGAGACFLAGALAVFFSWALAGCFLVSTCFFSSCLISSFFGFLLCSFGSTCCFYSLASWFTFFSFGAGFGVSCLAGATSSFLWVFFPLFFLASRIAYYSAITLA